MRTTVRRDPAPSRPTERWPWKVVDHGGIRVGARAAPEAPQIALVISHRPQRGMRETMHVKDDPRSSFISVPLENIPVGRSFHPGCAQSLLKFHVERKGLMVAAVPWCHVERPKHSLPPGFGDALFTSLNHMLLSKYLPQLLLHLWLRVAFRQRWSPHVSSSNPQSPITGIRRPAVVAVLLHHLPRRKTPLLMTLQFGVFPEKSEKKKPMTAS